MFFLRFFAWLASREATNEAPIDQSNRRADLKASAMRAWSIGRMIGNITNYHDQRR